MADKLTVNEDEGLSAPDEPLLPKCRFFLERLADNLVVHEDVMANEVGRWIQEQCPHVALDAALADTQEHFSVEGE